MSTNSNYDQIIQAINDTNNNHDVGVYVPSVSRHVKFKPMTINHQKKIISTALDNTLISNANHSILASDIINECCREPDIELYTLDKNPILVGLRCETLGYDINAQNDEGESIKTNIETHVQAFSSIEIPGDLMNTQEIVHDNIKIKIKPPTLEDDTRVGKQVYNNIKSNNFDNADDIRNTIGDAIIYEYVKYIKSVEIGDIHVPFDHDHAIELTRVVESLPIAVSSQILKIINNIKSIENKFLQLNDQEQQLTIVTDARFYNSE